METVFGSRMGSSHVGWSAEHLPARGNFAVYIHEPFDRVLIPVKGDHSEFKRARKQAYNTAYRQEENVVVINSDGRIVYTALNGW